MLEQTEMALLLQRMCWNEHLWMRPSGLPKDAGYPKEQKFGWDEWNFNLDDQYHGYVYGHTPYSPSDDAKSSLEQTFCVGFWTKDPDTGKRYLVGFYEGAEWTSLTQSREFDSFLSIGGKSARWERRCGELVRATGRSKSDIAAELRPIGEHTWKFRCRTDHVSPIQWRSLPDQLVEKHQRLSRPRVWSEATTAADLLDVCSVVAPQSLGYERVTPGFKVFIEQNEEKLRHLFVSFLRSRPSHFTAIQREVEQNDVRFRHKGTLTIAELKSARSYGSQIHAIRLALGQLLSYNHAPGRRLISHWWLVLDEDPDAGARRFVRNVTVVHKMPLLIAYPRAGSFEIWDPRFKTR